MSVSTASETISTGLTDSAASSFFTTSPKEILQCMSFNIRMLIGFSLLIVLLCICMSCMNSMIPPPYDDEDDKIAYRSVSYMMCKCDKGNCKCKGNVPKDIIKQHIQAGYFQTGPQPQPNVQKRSCASKSKSVEEFGNSSSEHFSNDELYSFKTAARSSYQNVPLLSPNDSNLLFGQAKRYISVVDGEMVYRLEVYCNLFVLDGNVYDTAPRNSVKQKYSVFLQNTKRKGTMFVGDLVRDGDGMYKLKYISNKNVGELSAYDKINIVYTLNTDEQVVLSGSFQ